MLAVVGDTVLLHFLLHTRCAAPKPCEAFDAFDALRMRTGSIKGVPSSERDIYAANPRVCVSAAVHALVGW